MENFMIFHNGLGTEHVMESMFYRHWRKHVATCGLKKRRDFFASWLHEPRIKMNIYTYICGIGDFRVSRGYEPFSSERKEEWNLGGAELLLAHGLPTASWAAFAMRTSRFNVVGLSNRGLATLAGNSMHVASAARLSMMCVFVVFFFILRVDFECLLSRTMTKKLRLHRPCWQQSLHGNWRRVVFQRAILVTHGQITTLLALLWQTKKLLVEFMHHFDTQTQETANFDRADKVQQGWSLVYVTHIWGESVDWNGSE